MQCLLLVIARAQCLQEAIEGELCYVDSMQELYQDSIVTRVLAFNFLTH